MTIKEFCEKYNKDEKNVRAKVFRYKGELKDHISKMPNTKALNLDDYAVEFLLEDRRSRYNRDISEQPTEEEEFSLRPNNVDMFPHWSADKKQKVMDICFREVKKYWYSLRYIPDEFKTYELCKYAVENQGLALEYVPKWFVTQEICDIAVKENSIALAYVPEKFITREMVKIAFDNCTDMRKRIKGSITMSEMDAANYLLKYVPDRFVDKDICLKALAYCASNAQFIPSKYMEDEEMIIEANKDIVSREYIPKWYWTKEHVIETIKKYTDDKRRNGLVGIPREAFNYDFYLELIEAKVIELEDVWTSDYYSGILTPEERNSIRQLDIDKEEQYEALKELIQKDSNNFRLISLDDERYYRYAMYAVCKCGEALKYIPVERRDFDLCKAAIVNDPNSIRYVPEEFKKQIMDNITGRTDWLRYLFDDGYFSDILCEK